MRAGLGMIPVLLGLSIGTALALPGAFLFVLGICYALTLAYSQRLKIIVKYS